MSLESEYLSRLRDAVSTQSSMGRLSVWLEKNTKMAGRGFSFRNHEFQLDICDSTHNDIAVIKPSQVGLTELIIRQVLGFLATTPDTVSMYLMPTKGEANHISKSRVDPVIRSSNYLREVVVPGSDSASFKQIGSSQLVMGGTFGKAVISVPTDLLVFDELDFSNPENVITAESRVTHSRFEDPRTGVRGLKRKWSTPTAKGTGVDALYSRSDKRKRLVRCVSCTEWFWPDWLEHCVVQGWDKPFSEMTYMDGLSLESRGLIETARLVCPHCRAEVKKSNLFPEHREWVAENPSILDVQGWQVSPFDVPTYHTPASILRKMVAYKSETAHFRNFTLGQAYSDASNSFVPEKITEFTRIQPVFPDRASGVSGCVAGLDVGKVSWFIVGKPLYDGSLHILYAEQIRLRDETSGELTERVVFLLNAFKVIQFVCDSLPYTDSILSIQSARPEGWVLPADYNLRDTKLPIYMVNDRDHTISINRTKSFNLTSKKVNSGKIIWPVMEEMDTVTKHLKAISRADRVTEDQEHTSEWVSSGPDHYAHALNYLTMAWGIVETHAISGWAPLPSISGLTIGSRAA